MAFADGMVGFPLHTSDVKPAFECTSTAYDVALLTLPQLNVAPVVVGNALRFPGAAGGGTNVVKLPVDHTLEPLELTAWTLQ